MRVVPLVVAGVLLLGAAACSSSYPVAPPVVTNHPQQAVAPLGKPSATPPTTPTPVRHRQPRSRRSRYVSGESQVPCRSGELTARAGVVGAAAGSAGVVVTLQNSSFRACTMRGYPELARLNAHHRRMTANLSRGGGMLYATVKARTVRLPPGGVASFAVEWGDNVVGNETVRSCRPSFFLRVTPPGTTAHLVVRTGRPRGPQRAVSVAACGSYLTITPVQPGNSPRRPL